MYLVSEALVPSNLTLQRQEPQGSQSVVHSNVHDSLKQEIRRVAHKDLVHEEVWVVDNRTSTAS